MLKAASIYRGGFYLYSMKIKILVIVFILFVKVSFAQQELLSFDEHNKYIFYQVTELPGLPSDTLHDRGIYFLKTLFPRIKFKPTTTLNDVGGEGKFLTYSVFALIKHESGEVNYHVNIEFKDGKYRFWLTDFIFVPYERDRYGNFVPKLGILIPLENVSAKLEKKESNDILNEVGAFCKQFGERLKIYMLNAPKNDEKGKKVVSDKW